MASRDTADTARSPVEEYRRHAEFHASSSSAGIGAAVIRSRFEDGAHVWDCIVTDTREWHYLRVVGVDLGPFPNVSLEDVEQGIEHFAATLPEQDRIRHLLNANPLHVDSGAHVGD